MTVSLIFIALSALVCLFGPAALALYMIRKRGAWPMSLLLGAAVFAVFQILTRVPLLGALQNTPSLILFSTTQPLLYALMLALSAGIFEEVGRYIAARGLMKGRLTWENAVVFGLGHGGLEALWLVGVNFTVLFFQGVGGQAAVQILSSPPTWFLAPGVERVLTVAMHIGFTMLVFYAVKRRKPLWLVIAIAAHMAVDTVAGMISLKLIPVGVWASEGILAVMAALAVLLTMKFKPILSDKNAAQKPEGESI